MWHNSVGGIVYQSFGENQLAKGTVGAQGKSPSQVEKPSIYRLNCECNSADDLTEIKFAKFIGIFKKEDKTL